MYIVFLALKIVLILANSADPDEMQHHAAFHLHCLRKYLFKGFQYIKGLCVKFRTLKAPNTIKVVC